MAIYIKAIPTLKGDHLVAFKKRLYLCKLNITKHKDTMAQVILSYDGRNKTARSIVEILRSLECFHITETTPKSRRKSGIDLAMEDVAAGRVFQAKDGADLIRQCLED